MSSKVFTFPSSLERIGERLRRLIVCVPKVLMMNTRETAELFGISKGEFLRMMRNANPSEFPTARGWFRFCETVGLDFDSCDSVGVTRAEALHLHRSALNRSSPWTLRFHSRYMKHCMSAISGGIGSLQNLSTMDISDDDLARIDLSHADLTLVNASKSDFSYSSLVGSSLNWGDFEKANFKKTDLSHASMSWSLLYGADLSQAIVKGTDFYGSIFDETTRLPFDRNVAKALGMEFVSSEVGALRRAFDRKSALDSDPEHVVLRFAKKGSIQAIAEKLRRRTQLAEAKLF